MVNECAEAIRWYLWYEVEDRLAKKGKQNIALTDNYIAALRQFSDNYGQFQT